MGLSAMALNASAHDFEVNGIYYNVLSFTDLTCEVTYKGTSPGSTYPATQFTVSIPETVEYNTKLLKVIKVGDQAFRDEKNLETVIIGANVKEIGKRAFDSSVVKNVVIPEGIKTIPYSCFAYCYNLTALTLPASVTKIENDAFRSSGLTSFEIPNTVESIGSYCFEGCKSLESVTLSENLTELPFQAFSGTTKLHHITIPNKINIIEHSAFSGSGLVEVKIGDNEQPLIGKVEIKKEAFSGCANLAKVYLAGNVSKIDTKAFSSCSALRYIYSYAVAAPELYDTYYTPADNAFPSTVYIESVLNVPVGAETSYKNAPGWKNFWNIQPSIENVNEIYSYDAYVTYGNKFGKVMINGQDSDHLVVYTGEDVTFTVILDRGYHLKSLTLNDEEVPAQELSETFTVKNIDKSLSLRIEFARTTVGLAITMAESGRLSTKVDFGSVYNFTIAAEDGWEVSTVTFNGNNVTSMLVNGGYTTPEIVRDSELNVVYRKVGGGVSDAAASLSSITVLPAHGQITIDGADAADVVTVYTLDGRKVAETTEKVIPLASGNIYIVTVAAQTFKVAL